ncbi:MAG TPA: hypothetical protein VMI31_04045, partial [Fimbriimonadaceae bacterium]|nr:hypothetical protein [Fimbriimonadaceae bacterium]
MTWDRRVHSAPERQASGPRGLPEPDKSGGPRIGLVIVALAATVGHAQTFIGIAPHASPQESFAAREVERYVYLRTG